MWSLYLPYKMALREDGIQSNTWGEGLGWPRCVCITYMFVDSVIISVQHERKRDKSWGKLRLYLMMEKVDGFIEPHMNARGRITSCACNEGTPQATVPRNNYGLVGTQSLSHSLFLSLTHTSTLQYSILISYVTSQLTCTLFCIKSILFKTKTINISRL